MTYGFADQLLAQGGPERAAVISVTTSTVAIGESVPAPYSSKLMASGFPSSPDRTLDLPDAPSHIVAGDAMNMFDASTTTSSAPKYARVISAGQLATHLAAGDKVVLGLGSAISLNSAFKAVLAAGYTHLTDGQPNYGVDSTAFAQRVGAGAARSASQDIFTESVMAPILHQDPRYYVLGPDARLVHRIIYAATRPLITRTDGGRRTVNGSLLIGYAGASLLARAYYPQINRNSTDEFKAYGTSIGGSAIGFVFDEFADQLLRTVHMRHRATTAAD